MEALDIAKLNTLELDEMESEVTVFKSSDGKNTVSVVLKGQNKTKDLIKALHLGEFLVEVYGTKQNQARVEYSKPMSKPQEVSDREWCAIHSVKMYRFEKDGRSWYSHKDPGSPKGWCSGK